jgi:N-methylhydantoinase B
MSAFVLTSREPAQVTGNINVTPNATQAAVCYTLKALLDPDVPNNQGVLDLPSRGRARLAPQCNLPARVAARANTCQRIIDVVIERWPTRYPASRGAANGANTTASSPASIRVHRHSTSISKLWAAALAAAPPGRDRWGAGPHHQYLEPAGESIEMEYPLLVESYGLIEDSAG